MANPSQRRASHNYRTRLADRGMTRFEVQGLEADRELIRSLAKRLAQNDDEASRIRVSVTQTIGGEPPAKGGILAALRRSPLVGADLDFERLPAESRKVEL